MVYLTRRYRFSASHRLHHEGLTPEENHRLYGKCNSPYGHGHDYVLHVTVAGEPQPETGMVLDLGILDEVVQREVLEPFDVTYLNLDVESFRRTVPTTENVCVEIFNRLAAKIGASGPARLERVRLEETASNFFEYAGGRSLSGESRRVP